jgi:hypothetical protein
MMNQVHEGSNEWGKHVRLSPPSEVETSPPGISHFGVLVPKLPFFRGKILCETETDRTAVSCVLFFWTRFAAVR